MGNNSTPIFYCNYFITSINKLYYFLLLSKTIPQDRGDHRYFSQSLVSNQERQENCTQDARIGRSPHSKTSEGFNLAPIRGLTKPQ